MSRSGLSLAERNIHESGFSIAFRSADGAHETNKDCPRRQWLLPASKPFTLSGWDRRPMANSRSAPQRGTEDDRHRGDRDSSPSFRYVAEDACRRDEHIETESNRKRQERQIDNDRHQPEEIFVVLVVPNDTVIRSGRNLMLSDVRVHVAGMDGLLPRLRGRRVPGCRRRQWDAPRAGGWRVGRGRDAAWNGSGLAGVSYCELVCATLSKGLSRRRGSKASTRRAYRAQARRGPRVTVTR